MDGIYIAHFQISNLLNAHYNHIITSTGLLQTIILLNLLRGILGELPSIHFSCLRRSILSILTRSFNCPFVPSTRLTPGWGEEMRGRIPFPRVYGAKTPPLSQESRNFEKNSQVPTSCLHGRESNPVPLT